MAFRSREEGDPHEIPFGGVGDTNEIPNEIPLGGRGDTNHIPGQGLNGYAEPPPERRARGTGWRGMGAAGGGEGGGGKVGRRERWGQTGSAWRCESVWVFPEAQVN
jgi:hypothetical protein